MRHSTGVNVEGTDKDKSGVGGERSSVAMAPVATLYGALALCVVALCLVYAGTLGSIESIWTESEAYGHGYLVLPLALIMLYCDRSRLAGAVVRVRPWGIAGMLVLSLLWGVSKFAGLEIFQQLAVYAMVGMLLGTWFGVRSLLSIFAFAYGYLLLAIPIWSSFVGQMQDATASAAVPALQMLGVPVFREDRYLAIPSGLFEVAQACAGLRYLLATLAIMGAYAVLNLRLMRNRVLLVVLSAVASIVFNWVRVIIVIGSGHLSEMQNAIVHGQGHVVFGWCVFGVCMLCLLGLGAWMKRWEDRQLAVQTRSLEHAGRSGAVERECGGRVASVSRTVVVTVALVGSMSLGPLASRAFEWMSPVGAGYVPELSSVVDSAAWRSPRAVPASARQTEGAGAWRPRFVGAHDEGFVRFESTAAGGGGDDNTVSVYLAYYERQAQGVEVVNDTNAVFDSTTWNVYYERQLVGSDVGTAAGSGVGGDPARGLSLRYVHETQLETGPARRLVWRVYWVGGQAAATNAEAKRLQLVSLVSRVGGAGVVSIATDYEKNGRQAARVRLNDMLQRVYPIADSAFRSRPAGKRVH